MISQEIIGWYREFKRPLPWREINDPYKIWLSEIILQQTRVEQGKPYYYKFIEAFPSVEVLAKASEQDVLRLWQGLGYYSRARNLHYTAKFIQNDLKGIFPQSFAELLKLKGIGPYTAAAIASFAYGEPKAVVDGNVYRVLSRIFNIQEPINSPKGIKLFQKIADETIDLNNPGIYNQAIMELGAMICKPISPSCDICPVNNYCKAKKEGNIALLPVKIKRIKVRRRFFQYLVFTFNDKWLLNKREPGDIWQGMYDFPLIETKKLNAKEDVIDFLKANKIQPKSIKLSQSKKHILSHQIIEANFWEIELNYILEPKSARFFSKIETELLPKPKLIVNYIQKNEIT